MVKEHAGLIDGIALTVMEACRANTNTFGYGIWTHHIQHVADYARDLARLLGADQEVVIIAALLRDYAAIKDPGFIEQHHIHGAAEAERILQAAGYPEDRIDLVKKCILSHRSSVRGRMETKEEACLASADAMAHIEQLASLFYAVYRELGMDIDAGRAWVLAKVERDWEKMCAEAKALMREKYEAIRLLFGGTCCNAGEG
ncbi:MAG: HD domain-containing protein [Bacillota bacterium]